MVGRMVIIAMEKINQYTVRVSRGGLVNKATFQPIHNISDMPTVHQALL